MEDEYFYIIPDNYFANNEVEEEKIKKSFIEMLNSNGVNPGEIDKKKLNGICGKNEGLTSNLKTQTNSDILLYVKCDEDLVAAVTIKLDFLTGEMDFEEENGEMEEEIPWEISSILIQTLCSKRKGYGRKIIEKIKNILYSCADDGLGEAVIQLDYTRESKGFYEKLDFKCENAKCILNIHTSGGTKHKLKRKIRKKTKKSNFYIKKQIFQ
jgi:hypothetical protein